MDELQSIREQILSNSHKLHAKGIDQTDVFNVMNTGADDNMLERFGYGLREFTSSGAKTLGKWTGNKEWEQEADANLKYIKSREDAWKRKEAKDSGRNPEDIWNVSGGFGMVTPYVAGGVAGGISKAPTLLGRVAGNVGRGLTPDLGLSLMEHGYKDTVGRDTALNVGLGMVGVAGGQVLGDKVIAPLWNKYKGRTPNAATQTPQAPTTATDDAIAAGLSTPKQNVVPTELLFDAFKKPQQVPEQFRREVIDPNFNPRADYNPNFRIQPDNLPATYVKPKVVENIVPRNARSEAAKQVAENKRLILEKLLGADEDKINAAMQIPKRSTKSPYENMDAEAIKYMDENTPLQPSPPVTKEDMAEANRMFGGEPVYTKAYHGTQQPMKGDLKDNTFFTNKPEYAEQYAGKDTRYYPNRGANGETETYFQKGGAIAPANLDIQNPKVVTKAATQHDPAIEKQIIEQAKKDGYDGLHIKYEGTDRVDYVPFDKKSVKNGYNGNTAFAMGQNELGGALGGGTLGGTEEAYQDIVNGKDSTLKDYLTKIVGGAAAGALLGGKYGSKADSSTASMFGAGAKKYPKVIAEDVDTGYYSKLENALNGLNQRKNKPINVVTKHDLMTYLKKNGIKDEELEWSGFNKQVAGLKSGDKITISDLNLKYPKFSHYENDAETKWSDDFFREQLDERVESDMSAIRDSGELYDDVDNIYYSNGYYEEDLADFKLNYSDEIEKLAKEQYGDDWEQYLDDVADSAKYNELEDEWYQTKEYNEGQAYSQAEQDRRAALEEEHREDLEYLQEQSIEDSGTQYHDYRANIGEQYSEKRASVEHPDMDEMYNPNGARHWDEDNNLYHTRSEVIRTRAVDKDVSTRVKEAQAVAQEAKSDMAKFEQTIIAKYGDVETAKQNITPDERSLLTTKMDTLSAANKEVDLVKARNRPTYKDGETERLFIQEIQSDHHQGTTKYESEISAKDREAKKRYEGRLHKLDTLASKNREEMNEIRTRFNGGEGVNAVEANKVLKLRNTIEKMIKSSPDIDRVNFGTLDEPQLLNALMLGDEFKGHYKNIIDMSEGVKKQLKTNREWSAVKETMNKKFQDPKTDAPYKKTWWQKAIKDQIQKAVDDGYGEIAFNTSTLKNGGKIDPEQGMIDFYDNKVPSFVEKHLKTFDDSITMKKDRVDGVDMYVFELTDKAKNNVRANGQSLYASQAASGGAAGTAVGATNDLDGDGKITFKDILIGAGAGALAGKLFKTKDLPKTLSDAPVEPELIMQAAKGDKEAFDTVAGAVFSRTFERIVNKNTGDKLKPMVLDKLIDNPNMIEDLAGKFGFNLRYFSSNPENVGKPIGNTFVEARPATRQKLKKQGYEAGQIWVYDPHDTHGSFNDPEYTKAWRGVHELAHAITERIMQAKYGDSRRFGALGNATKNPYDAADPRTYKALTTEEAQRAIEWEDVAFRTQLKLLDGMGIKVNKQEALNDFNIAGSDTVIRTLTGDFSNPENYGVLPRKDDYRINVKNVLGLLQNQEGALAKYQGREATRGIDLNTWKPVDEKEIDAVIKDALDNPLQQPAKLNGDTAQISIEAVAGADVAPALKEAIQSLSPREQSKYHEEMYKALTDQAGTSTIAKKLGLEVGEYNNLAGVWKGEVNPSAQIQVKAEVDAAGNLTEAFKSKLDDMAEMYAIAFKQDGVGWHHPVYKQSDNVAEHNGIEFIAGKKLSGEATVALEKQLDDALHADFAVVSTEKGARILNMSDLPNTEFQKAVEGVLEKSEVSGEVAYFRAESNLIEGAVNGNNITKNSLKRRPDLQEWFNTHIEAQVERVNQRFTAIAKENGYQADRAAAKQVANGTTLHASSTMTGAAVGGATGAVTDLDGDGKITSNDILIGAGVGAAGLKGITKLGAAEKLLNKGIQKSVGKTLSAADHLTGKVVSNAWNAAKKSDLVDIVTGHKIYGKETYMALREKMVTSLNKNQVNHEKLHRQLKNLSEGARENLYEYMTGNKAVQLTPDLKRFADEFTESIDNRGQQLVDLGVLEQAQLDRFKGQYLHRRYEKHLTSTAAQTFRKGTAIQGVHARGNAWVGTKTEYDKLAAEGKLGNFTDGKIEAHRMANGQYKFTQDWTAEQRASWGEVKDIAYSLPETLNRMDDMIANATMLKRIADDSPYVEDVAVDGYKRLEGKKFGSLNGKYVAADVANDITEFAEQMHGLPDGTVQKVRQAWRDYLSMWKASHTIYNGKAHMNNLLSNITFQFMEGVSPDKAVLNAGRGFMAYKKVNRLKDLEAKKLIGLDAEEAAEHTVLKQDDDVTLFMQAEEAGLFGRSALNDILFKYISPSNGRNANGAMAKIHDKAQSLYQGEDNVMRFSLLKALTDKGTPFNEAITQVNNTIPDYSKPMSRAARWSRETGAVPFISWTYYSLPIMARQVKEKPARALAIPAVMVGLYNAFGIDPYNEKDIQTEGMSFKRVPIYKNGNEITTLKVDKWIPHGELLNPYEFTRGMVTGGVPQQIVSYLNNHNPYFNNKITRKKDGAGKAYDLAKYGVQGILPSPDILDQAYNLAESKLRSQKKRRKNKVIKPRTTTQELVNFLLNTQTYDQAEQRKKVMRESL